jgi:MFS family permease
MGNTGNIRWWVAGLLALATALNYLDRQSFPVVVGEIKKTIPISDEQYGQLTSLFLLAYAIMYAGGGRIMDWLGTRVGYAVMIVWWSAANFCTGLVSSVAGLGAFRFLLGMGEGGGFPGSGKAVAEWFPPKERAMVIRHFQYWVSDRCRRRSSPDGAHRANVWVALGVLHHRRHWICVGGDLAEILPTTREKQVCFE